MRLEVPPGLIDALNAEGARLWKQAEQAMPSEKSRELAREAQKIQMAVEILENLERCSA